MAGDHRLFPGGPQGFLPFILSDAPHPGFQMLNLWLEPFLLRHVPQGVPSSIIDAYVLWLERGATVSSYLLTGYWSDVGTPQRYAQVQQDFDSGRILLPA